MEIYSCFILLHLFRGRSLKSPRGSLFDLPADPLSKDDIATHKKEGQYYLGKVLVGEGKIEEAIKKMEEVDWPEASFYQAKVS